MLSVASAAAFGDYPVSSPVSAWRRSLRRLICTVSDSSLRGICSLLQLGQGARRI